LEIGGDGNLVAHNDVRGNPLGAGITIERGDRNAVRGNDASGFDDDIFVAADATNTLIAGNLATQPEPGCSPEVCDDGIHVEAPGTVIRANTATDNGDLGIYGVDGVIDGGGNRASGNGNPLQCVGVVCR
jgi:hypothetical protein